MGWNKSWQEKENKKGKGIRHSKLLIG